MLETVDDEKHPFRASLHTRRFVETENAQQTTGCKSCADLFCRFVTWTALFRCGRMAERRPHAEPPAHHTKSPSNHSNPLPTTAKPQPILEPPPRQRHTSSTGQPPRASSVHCDVHQCWMHDFGPFAQLHVRCTLRLFKSWFTELFLCQRAMCRCEQPFDPMTRSVGTRGQLESCDGGSGSLRIFAPD